MNEKRNLNYNNLNNLLSKVNEEHPIILETNKFNDILIEKASAFFQEMEGLIANIDNLENLEHS